MFSKVFMVFVGLPLLIFVNDVDLLEMFEDHRTTDGKSQMLNSCVCKLNGDIYNLTTLGIAGGAAQPFRSLSFVNTRELHQYFFNLCYPFSWPPTRPSNPKSKSKHKGKIQSEVAAYPCNNASLCQFDVRSNLPQFKAVTTQNIQNGMLRCAYNKTISSVQWIYKGVGRIFEKGGIVLTLLCDEKLETPEVTAQYDVDRRKGHPWKYISVKHKCCCPNKCTGGGHNSQQTGQKPKLALEIGAAGGGFLVLLLIMLAGYKIQQYCYGNQPPLPPPHPPVQKDYGTFMPKTIPYEEIENIRQIGEGAFGIVSKARWRNSDVAVKRIKEHVVEEDIEPFIRESIWMSKLPHHNIVQFYGVCVLKPNLCIVTEYMEGGSVADVIHKTGKILSWDTRIKWAIDAAKGMTYLHGQTPPIIHRDLKSDNLLVDENGLVKVADFGAVKLLEPIFARHHSAETKERKTEDSSQDATCDTLWAGTLRWSAPEVIPKKEDKKKFIKFTPASDVYSFGITVWELVSNKRPYYDTLWDHQIIDKIKNGIRPDFPENCLRSVKNFIDICWHGNPDARPTFEDILAQLNNVKHNVEIESNGRIGGTWPPFSSQTLRHAASQAL